MNENLLQDHNAGISFIELPYLREEGQTKKCTIFWLSSQDSFCKISFFESQDCFKTHEIKFTIVYSISICESKCPGIENLKSLVLSITYVFYKF